MQRRDSDDPALETDDQLSAIIGRETGLRLQPQQTAAVRAWNAERVRVLGLGDIHELERLLGQDSPVGRSERQLLNEQLTTAESYFFRDAGQIDLLASTILPELIALRAPRQRLRIWSAGCSTGEEAYTLAMLIDELGPSLAGWDIQIVASDINPNALEKARLGLYSAWSFHTTDASRKARYFEPQGSEWQIVPRLREQVSFRELDLVRDRFPDEDAGLTELDLILCRNVFVYLNDQATGTVFAKLAASIADGGYLIAGHSELFAHETAPLRTRVYPQSTVYQNAPETLAEPLPTRPGARIAKVWPLPRTAAARRSLETEQESTAASEIMQRAWHHADGGRRDEAARACRAAIEAAPSDARAYFLLAQLAQERSATSEAKELFRMALYLDPGFVAACLELAALHMLENDGVGTRRMFRSAKNILRQLPASAPIPPYATSTAADVLAYVKRMLGDTER